MIAGNARVIIHISSGDSQSASEGRWRNPELRSASEALRRLFGAQIRGGRTPVVAPPATFLAALRASDRPRDVDNDKGANPGTLLFPEFGRHERGELFRRWFQVGIRLRREVQEDKGQRRAMKTVFTCISVSGSLAALSFFGLSLKPSSRRTMRRGSGPWTEIPRVAPSLPVGAERQRPARMAR